MPNPLPNRPRLRFALSLGLCAGLLAGCADFPKLDAAISPSARAAAYPTIAPFEQIEAIDTGGEISQESLQALETRAAGLRARAARLRRTIVDRETRARMDAALARNAQR
ncbi:MAG: hypothetical protein ACRBBK_02930 [Paracoccaceae bacterium]